MSVLQGESAGAAHGSPMKKNRLSLKFFQKKETKRALDFSEPQAEEPKTEPHEPESRWVCDTQMVCLVINVFSDSILFRNGVPHSVLYSKRTHTHTAIVMQR